MGKNTKKLKRKNYDCSTKKFNGGRGITLIALVITIIVLLILAGVTIASLTGQNGILGNASKAKTQTEIANEKETVELAETTLETISRRIIIMRWKSANSERIQ